MFFGYRKENMGKLTHVHMQWCTHTHIYIQSNLRLLRMYQKETGMSWTWSGRPIIRRELRRLKGLSWSPHHHGVRNSAFRQRSTIAVASTLVHTTGSQQHNRAAHTHVCTPSPDNGLCSFLLDKPNSTYASILVCNPWQFASFFLCLLKTKPLSTLVTSS